MDFFNSIGKKFSNAAKSVQQRTRETVSATKLNGELRDLKAEKTKLFKVLGETYFEVRDSEGAKEQLELICSRIEQINGECRAINLKLDALNRQKRCPGCDAVIDEAAKFCPKCGAKLPEPAEEKPEEKPETDKALDYCPGCGAIRKGDGIFCEVCGAAYDEPEAAINWPDANDGEAPEE